MHDAEKCPRSSDDIMLHFFDLDADGFRRIRPKTICIWGQIIAFCPADTISAASFFRRRLR
ncbi:hypothetical protein GFL49_23115 [Rhizobium leguminosarum bv. viciae]|nr:hypothetical protein [Rhizobium leguminosarum bv. viciae]NKL36630.1 hypothetical protein [Rhizobium leguminosarum bv. viciae]